MHSFLTLYLLPPRRFMLDTSVTFFHLHVCVVIFIRFIYSSTKTFWFSHFNSCCIVIKNLYFSFPFPFDSTPSCACYVTFIFDKTEHTFWHDLFACIISNVQPLKLSAPPGHMVWSQYDQAYPAWLYADSNHTRKLYLHLRIIRRAPRRIQLHTNKTNKLKTPASQNHTCKSTIKPHRHMQLLNHDAVEGSSTTSQFKNHIYCLSSGWTF